MQCLAGSLACVLLCATLCGGAWAQEASLFDALDELSNDTAKACGQVASAVDAIYFLSQLGYAAPSEATQQMHLDAIVYVFQGAGGPDVRAPGAAKVLPPGKGSLPTETVEGRTQVRSDGLLGALAYAESQLAIYRAFAVQPTTGLALYYQTATGWDGESMMTELLDDIEGYWRQVDSLCRFALDAALQAQREPSSLGVENALLKVNAFATAAVGYPDHFDDRIRAERWTSGGMTGAMVPCAFYLFHNELQRLASDLFHALRQAARS